jgi:hypothetical protein
VAADSVTVKRPSAASTPPVAALTKAAERTGQTPEAVRAAGEATVPAG